MSFCVNWFNFAIIANSEPTFTLQIRSYILSAGLNLTAIPEWTARMMIAPLWVTFASHHLMMWLDLTLHFVSELYFHLIDGLGFTSVTPAKAAKLSRCVNLYAYDLNDSVSLSLHLYESGAVGSLRYDECLSGVHHDSWHELTKSWMLLANIDPPSYLID